MQPTGHAADSSSLFTVAVFQDVPWANRALAALLADGFAAPTISLIAGLSPDVEALINTTLRHPPIHVEIKNVGPALAAGPLVAVLQGRDEGLTTSGIAATARRAGFQAHDGRIFELLTMRGGVLAAVQSDRRSADALAHFHAYGGGNAAIGAWIGRI
jgi:hypothetical protein